MKKLLRLATVSHSRFVPRRFFADAPIGNIPQWIQTLRDAEEADKGTAVSYDIKMKDEMLFEKERYKFDEKTYSDISNSTRTGFCAGDTTKEYVCIGEAYAFPDWQDNPVVNDPQKPAKLWWDPSVPTEKVLVQIADHIPPALWLPIKPTHGAVKRLFSDFTTIDAIHLERYTPLFEKIQTEYEQKSSSSLVDDASLKAADHFKDSLRFGSVNEIRKDYDDEIILYLGTVDHPSEVANNIEAEPEKNPSIFSWPLLVIDKDKPDIPSGCIYRTVYSKSMLCFMTRSDLSPRSHYPEEPAAVASVPLFVKVVFPNMPRMSGGKQLIANFNSKIGSEYPAGIPVDVAAALWRYCPVGCEKISKRLSRLVESLPAKLGNSHEDRSLINDIALSIVALSGVTGGRDEFLKYSSLLSTRPESQIRTSIAACYAALGYTELYSKMIAAETDEVIIETMKRHAERSKTLPEWCFQPHTLDTASVVENMDFTKSQQGSIDGQ
eukprot:TRINITY_DN13410_c0_g1_i1.p1 TRINITY_DN13410_c0_g1~~TRINITY_DN13410_c0_g1_i1.p1  ORF type:complete len:494 (+),score=97.49 TRINITY_DN13410_c0_g1_i1:52-1533(+)